MLSMRDILGGVLLPLVVAVILGLLARRAAAWAIALAFAGGYVTTFGWPGVPPGNGYDWLALAAPLVGLAGFGLDLAIGRGRRSSPAWRGMLATFAASAVISYLLFQPLKEGLGGMSHVLLWTIGVALLATLHAWHLSRLGQRWAREDSAPESTQTRRSDSALGLLLALIAAPTAVVAMLSGSQRFGQTGGMLALATGGLWLVLLWRKQAFRSGALTVWAALWMGLLAVSSTFFYADMTQLHSLLLLGSPLLAWVSEVPPLRNKRPWVRVLVGIGAALLPCLIAAGMAALAAKQAYMG